MRKIIWVIVRSQWDRTAAFVLVVLGMVVLLLGWIGVASTSFPAEQLPYIISGGICGIMLVGIATALWISADLRDEWRKLDEIAELLRDAQSDAAPTHAAATFPAAPSHPLLHAAAERAARV